MKKLKLIGTISIVTFCLLQTSSTNCMPTRYVSYMKELLFKTIDPSLAYFGNENAQKREGKRFTEKANK